MGRALFSFDRITGEGGPESVVQERLRGAVHGLDGGQGLVTAQVGRGGSMRVEWARVERCGRIALGQYCLHFHLVGPCADCAFIGNVVEGGVNKGITLHGTHNATVDANVVYDLRGASIYVEDGNELHNTLSHNLLLCPSLSHKAQLGGLVPQIDGVAFVLVAAGTANRDRSSRGWTLRRRRKCWCRHSSTGAHRRSTHPR